LYWEFYATLGFICEKVLLDRKLNVGRAELTSGGMRKLSISFAIFLLAMGMMFYWHFKSKSPDEMSQTGGTSAGTTSAAPIAPRNPREQLYASYRLGPDRRCLRAVAEINRMLTSAELAVAEAEFDRGQWRVRYRAQEVGTLPEFPDFPDLLRLLTNYAGGLKPTSALKLQSVGQARPEIAHELDALRAIPAAQMTDRLWRNGPRNAELLRQGMQSLTLLAFLNLDQVHASDLVAARALATLAVVESATGQPAAREECLQAQAMGYFSHACNLAARLPATDPLRQYLQREDRALETSARAQTSSMEARYLQARRLAEKRDLFGWLNYVDRHLSKDAGFVLPLLQSGLTLDWFETREELSAILARQVLLELGKFSPATAAPEAGGAPGETNGLLARIESALDKVEVQPGGLCLDRGLIQAYYRGCYYSALKEAGLHYLDYRSSIQAASRFAESLGPAPAGPAAEFKDWYAHLVVSKEGHGSLADLRGDLGSLGAFGQPLLSRTFEEIEDLVPYGETTLLDAGRELSRKLDSRPKNVLELGVIAHQNLLAFGLAEKLLVSGIAAQQFHELRLQAWDAAYRGDRHRLEELLALPELEPKEKFEVLLFLQNQEGVTTNLLRQEYERLIAAQPDAWSVTSAYADYLEKQEDYPTARRFTQAWLDRKVKNVSGFDEILARTALARMYYHQGRYAEGLKAIEPVGETHKLSAMQRKALLLDRLGREQEAAALAQTAHDLYPDNLDALALMVELDWRHGRYPQAAAHLAHWPYPINSTDWRWNLGPLFLDCFKGRDAEAVSAAEAMIAVNLGRGHQLGQFAAEAANHGNPALAFDIQSRLRTGGLEQFELSTGAYGYLKAWKGQAAALEWVRQRIPAQDRMTLAMFAHEPDHPELLWEVAPAQLSGFGADYYWLMRAAASLKPGTDNASRRQALKEYYEKNNGSYYDLAGRYLLGMADEKDVVAAAVTPKQQCELYYFIGFKAQQEGRIRDAADWYWLSIATGLINNGEAHWAYNQLHSWKNASKSLSRLEAEAARAPAEKN